MKDVAGLHEMLQDLYTIHPRNIYFVRFSLLIKGCIEKENTVLDVLSLVIKVQEVDAIKMIEKEIDMKN